MAMLEWKQTVFRSTTITTIENCQDCAGYLDCLTISWVWFKTSINKSKISYIDIFNIAYIS